MICSVKVDDEDEWMESPKRSVYKEDVEGVLRKGILYFVVFIILIKKNFLFLRTTP